MTNCVRVHPADDVAVALCALAAGTEALGMQLRGDIPMGHKFALRDIARGEKVIKYGQCIGTATRDIGAGEWVHTHNLVSALSGRRQYVYRPEAPDPSVPLSGSFMGYARADGRVGTRNELWILPMVGCVNAPARALAQRAREALHFPVYAFEHPYGCSQLGEDHARTRALLAAMARHPNAGGVLALGLGCENNRIADFRQALGDVDESRFAFFNAQDVPNEMDTGMEALRALARTAQKDERTPQPLDKLVIGLKCGGSDGLSGLTANPLLGALADGVCAAGGRALLTEVPEMFGAEELLMARCPDERVFERVAALINNYKDYFARYGQPVSENPSPGNKQGGITTLEEKSLGCVQKGGRGTVNDVLDYACPVRTAGLSLVYGPGNDICAVTALCAAGAQVILFTTGRGTPLGAPAPVIKVSTNSELAARKPAWTDFDAGLPADAESRADAVHALLARVLAVASGEPTASERMGCRDFAILKDGVTE